MSFGTKLVLLLKAVDLIISNDYRTTKTLIGDTRVQGTNQWIICGYPNSVFSPLNYYNFFFVAMSIKVIYKTDTYVYLVTSEKPCRIKYSVYQN